MGSKPKLERLTLKSIFPIYKVGQRVFQLDNIENVDNDFKDSIVKILDHGGKFIPCLHSNIIDTICAVIKQFEVQAQKLNTKLFFEKSKNNHKNDIINSNNVDRENIDMNDNNEIQLDTTKKDSYEMSINSCSNFDCIISKLKSNKKRNDSDFYLNNATIDFRFKVYSKLTKMNFSIQPNLSSRDIYFLKKFTREKPFSIIQCDKNIGLSIASNELMDKLCLEHLADTKTYLELKSNPIVTTITKINEVLTALKIHKQIKINLCNQLLIKAAKPGRFRILSKLHKENFGIRPIINNINHPTSKLCKLVDLILQPFVQKMPSYIKDSQHLLQKLHNANLTQDSVYLYTMDFESLYTNIDKSDAINLITQYIQDDLDTNYITSFAFYVILELIFDNNIFTYKTKYYVQKFGLSMGCICGPSIANIFVHILERKWLHIHKPLVYTRFIDDIFIASSEKIDENGFESYFLNLKLTILQSSSVNFLDLVIRFDTITKRFISSLYIKPTNTFSYLLTNSNHPEFIFNNIPKSLFIRIRRICDSLIDYYYFSRKLINQLYARGYNLKKMIAIAYSISKLNKSDLLAYKHKSTLIADKKSIFFGINYDKQANSRELILNSFDNMKTNFKWLQNYKLQIYNFMSANLTSIFVHNKRLESLSYTYKCKNLTCVTCKFINTNSYIMLKNGFIIPIMNNSCCETRHAVYIIRCVLCEVFYIGETGRRVSTRFKEHINAIHKFVPFKNYTTEIGYHFNLKSHDYRKHLQLYVFKNNLKSKEHRRSVEGSLIILMNQFNPPIINVNIPSKINSLCFLN